VVKPRTLVLAIGNRARGDDGAGPATARALRGALADGVELVEISGEAGDVLARLENAARVYVIDACASGAAPGTLHRFDVADAPLPHETFVLSSHGLGLNDAIELARALGVLPPICIVYAIEGAAFETGAPLSAAVAAAAEFAAAQILAELATSTVREAQANA
jgi:hydrogenase maturation protease